ncbi:MAG TPA: TetR/AcrR family transcriptional regulator [Acidobacteriaceae bacterium]|nr:TetR/AcrR family transcriptional regulator [Acidobacteriaceae bacterium]
MRIAKSSGNRDALLLAAKQCLLEKGYNRTTARDIAALAGVSLAAIGYHFSSKEALLTEALLLAFGEWDQDLQQTLRTAVPTDTDPAKRFEVIWETIMATFETHRALWVANFELFAQIVAQPAAREVIVGKLHVARAGLAAMFLNQDESTIDDRTVRTVGTFLHVLLSGVVLQWLMDPSSALSARNLTVALRDIAQELGKHQKKSSARSKSRTGKRPRK